MQNLLHATSNIGLHDCRVTRLTWSSDEGMRLDLDIDDFWSNHLDLPSYAGPTSGTISLLNVQSVDLALSLPPQDRNETVWILNFDVTEHAHGGYHAEICIPGGRIAVRFMDSICPKLERPAE